MQYQLKTLFSLLLLMESMLFSRGRYVDMVPCPNNEFSYGVLHFAVNTRMTFCCQLNEIYCNVTTFSDVLTLLPKDESTCPESCIAERMSRLDECLVKFEVANATSQDGGVYLCKLNGLVLDLHTVYIIEKPAPISITLFSCSQTKDLTVMFDRGDPSTTYTDFYIVTMNRSKSITVLCNYTSTNPNPLCKPDENICTCEYPSSNVRPTDKGTITVTVIRSVQNVSVSRDYNISAAIKPGPVKRLAVKDIGLHNASVQFCVHENLVRFMVFMTSRGAPLHFHILVFRKQGIPEVLNATIPAVTMTIFKCMRVYLHNLTAYTNYTVIVFTSGGGGQSQRSMKEFSTKQKVPTHPPLTDGFSFSRIEKIDDVTCFVMSALILTWKPLPYAAQGGQNFSYYIEVQSDNGFRFNKIVQETYVVVLNKRLPQDRLSAKIWAQNALGRSANYTTLEIPSKSENEQNLQKLMDTKSETMEIPTGESQSKCDIKLEDKTKLNVVVEMNGDKAVVYVNNTFLKVEILLAIHWCSKFTDENINGLGICQEYPQTADYNFTANADKAKVFEIDINKGDEHKEMLTYRLLDYCELNYLNSTPTKIKTANATVTLSPAGVDVNRAVADYDFYDYEPDPSKDDIYYDVSYDDMVRSRRDVEASNKGPIKVFISLKREDSSWNSGMIPVNCYFDRTKDVDFIVVSQFVDESDKSVSLRWNQECNPNTATHFITKYFMVYSSTDEKCDENDYFIKRVNNDDIFQPKILKLPKDVQFVCIKSCRFDDLCYAGFSATAVNYPHGDGTTIADQINVPAAVACSVIIFIILIIVATIFLWKRRGKHVRKNLEPHTKLQLPTEPNKMRQDDCSNKESPEESAGKTLLHSISVLSVDSGTGTALCDDDSRSHKNSSSSSEFHSGERSRSGRGESGEGDEHGHSDDGEGKEDDGGGSENPEKVQQKALKKIGNGWNFVKRNNENLQSLSSNEIFPKDSGHGTGLSAADSRNQKNKGISSELHCLENSETEDSYETEDSDDETEGSDDTEDESEDDSKTSAEFEKEQQKAQKMTDFAFTKMASENSQSVESTEQFHLSKEVDTALFRNSSQSRKKKNISPELHSVEKTAEWKESINNDESTVDCSDSDSDEVVVEECDNERCVASETEQMNVLKHCGVVFNRRNSGISQALGSSQANAADGESCVFTGCQIDNCGLDLDDVQNIRENSLHDHAIHKVPALSTSSLHRLLSSESESDGDCERAFLSLKHRDQIC